MMNESTIGGVEQNSAGMVLDWDMCVLEVTEIHCQSKNRPLTFVSTRLETKMKSRFPLKTSHIIHRSQPKNTP